MFFPTLVSNRKSRVSSNSPLEALAREGATVSRLQMLIIVDILFQLLINHRSGVFEKLIAAESNEGMTEQKET